MLIAPDPSTNVRRHVKRLVERGLLLSGISRFSRWRRRGDVLVLAYHNIVPHGAASVGDRSLHLRQEDFAAQLDLLRATHDVIALDEALTRGARCSGRASVVITFDDAYRGAVTAGVAELAARGLPATIFVPPALLDDGVFWWDVLTPAGADGVPPAARERALTELAGRGTAILQMAAGTVPNEIPPHARGASREELRSAATTPGITLGSHTWSHPNLAALPLDELETELVRPLVWLRDSFASAVPYLSFPYGLSSPEVEHAARTAGYRAALRIDGGWLPRQRANAYALPRLNIPSGLSLNGFRLRSAGVLS
jgi:peptidoglycan/xylan/chitin deacetylase (PgdA/CDA1 family)